MTLLFTYIVVALALSFLCSILEACLLTLTPSSIQAAKTRGARWAVRMEGFKNDLDRPLSAILTLNTMAHTMGAAGAGAEWARISGNAHEGLFAFALTIAILIFTEIIPKTLGSQYANAIAGPVSLIIAIFIRVLWPLVWMSQLLTRLITPKGGAGRPPHREELLAVARLGHESGELRERESQFVHNLMELHSMKAWDIMTPRPVIFALPQSTSLLDFVKFIEDKPFTRVPVYKGNRDEMVGFVIRGEALIAHLKDTDDTGTLEQVLRPIAVTSEETPVDELFQRFIGERHQIMLVIDEFGTTIGLVTFEDIIETIFGFEILDEKDKVPDMQAFARQLWLDRAKRMGIQLPEEVPVGEVGEVGEAR